MINKVLKTIKKYKMIEENDKIIIGVSGGPDSMCLLHILNILKKDLGFEIVVAHVNHMIREEAEEETKYVENFCKDNEIECFVKRVDVIENSKTQKIGTEEAGRKARYDFFEDVLNIVNGNKIATAHNANDNAETVLMNIFRGTGTAGLKGIEPIRNGKFIRPIIECERQEIEEYCKINNLEPKIDKTNFENIYTRNKIRNIMIPEIKNEFNPNIIEAINKLANIARQENEFIDSYIEDVLNNGLLLDNNNDGNNDNNDNNDNSDNNNNCNVINLKNFNELSYFVKSKVVISLIQKTVGTTQGIEKIHVDDIIKLCERNIGNKYLTPNKRIKIYVKKGKAYFIG